MSSSRYTTVPDHQEGRRYAWPLLRTTHCALKAAACNLPDEYHAADYTVLPSVRVHVVQTHCALTFQ